MIPLLKSLQPDKILVFFLLFQRVFCICLPRQTGKIGKVGLERLIYLNFTFFVAQIRIC